jgi:Tol biopolymer transport system component
MHPRRLRRPATALGLAAAVILITAATAAATFPGPAGRIAFNDFMTGQIYAVNPDGTGLVRLTDLPRRNVAFDQTWSPDGRRIVFSSNEARGFDAYLVRADGSHVHQLTEGGHLDDFWTTWFPGGGKIAFSRCKRTDPGGCAIFTVRADGSHLRQITPFRTDVFDVATSVSPDGSRMAFSRFQARGIVAQVIVMNVDGTGAHHITPARLQAFPPEWSPDGQRIIYSNACCKAHSSIFMSAADGSGRVRLTHPTYPHDDVFPVFSPDGNHIAFSSDRRYAHECCRDLFVAGVDGRNRTPITARRAGADEPDWGTAPLVQGGSSLSRLAALERAALASGRTPIRVGACHGAFELTFLPGGCPLPR